MFQPVFPASKSQRAQRASAGCHSTPAAVSPIFDAAGRTRTWEEWREWIGRRAGAGKLAPKGFPATKRFRPR